MLYFVQFFVVIHFVSTFGILRFNFWHTFFNFWYINGFKFLLNFVQFWYTLFKFFVICLVSIFVIFRSFWLYLVQPLFNFLSNCLYFHDLSGYEPK